MRPACAIAIFKYACHKALHESEENPFRPILLHGSISNFVTLSKSGDTEMKQQPSSIIDSLKHTKGELLNGHMCEHAPGYADDTMILEDGIQLFRLPDSWLKERVHQIFPAEQHGPGSHIRASWDRSLSKHASGWLTISRY